VGTDFFVVLSRAPFSPDLQAAAAGAKCIVSSSGGNVTGQQ